MEKPYTLQVIETEQKIVDIINNSQLFIHTLKTILQNIYSQLEKIDNEAIEKYKESIKKEYKNKKEKESDK